MGKFTDDPTTYKREYARKYRLTEQNIEYRRAYNKAYREKNREKLNEYNRVHRQTNKKHHQFLNKLERYRLRLDVLNHYSNEQLSCAKCGYSDTRALQLDHIDNDGAVSRIRVSNRRTAAGTTYYRWLRQNNYPEGYQVLCANCNVIKFQESINAYYPDSIQL